MTIGTIVELDPVDGLGWIEMDDGSRVRFGGTACKGFLPYPGTRVRVLGTAVGYRGVIKATALEAADPPPPPATPAYPSPRVVSYRELVAAHPRFSDVDEVVLTPSLAAPSFGLAQHPLLAPWHDEIARTAPVVIPLFMPDGEVEPLPTTSFARGTTAFLEDETWPRCGRCDQPLEMCIELAPEVMRPWRGDGRGFVVLFCFACGTSERSDPKVGRVGWVTPRVRVRAPEGHATRSSHPSQQTVAVEVGAPRRTLPSTLWYRYRSAISPDTAASALLGFDAPHLEELPDGWGLGLDDAEDLSPPYEPELIHDVFDIWSEGPPLPGDPRRGHRAWLGGAPSWDQADETPSCETHGPMVLLLDYDGGQFLDGCLHVFLCRDASCDATRFVAEF